MKSIYSNYLALKNRYKQYLDSKKDRSIQQIIYCYSNGIYVSRNELCRLVEYFYEKHRAISDAHDLMASEMNYEKMRWVQRINRKKDKNS